MRGAQAAPIALLGGQCRRERLPIDRRVFSPRASKPRQDTTEHEQGLLIRKANPGAGSPDRIAGELTRFNRQSGPDGHPGLSLFVFSLRRDGASPRVIVAQSDTSVGLGEHPDIGIDLLEHSTQAWEPLPALGPGPLEIPSGDTDRSQSGYR